MSGGLAAAFARTELLTAGGAEEGSTALHAPANRMPIHLLDGAAAIHRSLPTVVDSKHLKAIVQTHTHGGAYGSIHPR